MTFKRPSFRHPDLPANGFGLTRRNYEGAISTLCAGCGHDSIGTFCHILPRRHKELG